MHNGLILYFVLIQHKKIDLLLKDSMFFLFALLSRTLNLFGWRFFIVNYIVLQKIEQPLELIFLDL
jgi:hypothetical protein